MNLNDEQKQAVRNWVEDGAGLSDVQKRLLKEFSISLTYMDVRFLVIDLGLELKEPEGKKVVALPVDNVATAGQDGAAGVGAVPGGIGAGSVSVEVDRLMQPGSLVSGTVVFSDGTKATWQLDQRGRLGLKADTEGYRPSDDDLAAFQEEIQNALAKRGF